MRLGKKGKLSVKYVGPYEILQSIGKVACKLVLPMKFEKIHDVFHISQLKRYVPHERHILESERIQIDYFAATLPPCAVVCLPPLDFWLSSSSSSYI